MLQEIKCKEQYISNDYKEFLKSKQTKYIDSGFDISIDKLNVKLFDFQKKIVQWALKKGKCALFCDTGLGKTICQLEFAYQVCKHTNSNALILAPLAVSKQTQQEGIKFGYEVNICRTQADVKDGINITNYEMLEHFNPDKFNCVILDESSILKSFMGKTKRKLCNMLENVRYKLACTATPAPNDIMEILNHAEFLNVMKSNEALAIWFIADQKAMGSYRLKNHAINDFYRWVSSWAIGINTPADIGFSSEGYILPQLHEIDVVCDSNLFFGSKLGKLSAINYNKARKDTLKIRCEYTANIVNNSNEQFVVWCDLNDEAKLLKSLINNSVEISGSDSIEKKERAVIDFINGNIKVLISKPLIFGYGLNFQNCYNTVFCGLSYSYENYYQAVRRFYRFGQTHEVNVYRVVSDTERVMLDTLNRKAQQKNELSNNMIANIRDYQIADNKSFKLNLEEQKIIVPNWLEEE
jgi:SNF2 family DNA or RNA helicase